MQLWLFRISINPSRQLSLYKHPLEDNSRFDLIDSALKDSMPVIRKSTEYRFYNHHREGETVIGRIGHPDIIERSLPTENGSGLVDFSEESESWVHYVFTDHGEQVMAVQRKQKFFAGNPDGMADIIHAILAETISDDQVVIAVKPITMTGNFWSQIKDATKLYKVSFDFVPPNMFKGRKPLADLLELQHKMHNNTLFKASIENQDGNLSFPENDQTIAEVDYAAAGGGGWEMDVETERSGRHTVRSGADAPVNISIEDDEQSGKSIEHLLDTLLNKIRKWL